MDTNKFRRSRLPTRRLLSNVEISRLEWKCVQLHRLFANFEVWQTAPPLVATSPTRMNDVAACANVFFDLRRSVLPSFYALFTHCKNTKARTFANSSSHSQSQIITTAKLSKIWNRFFRKPTVKMSTTVHVQGISHETTEKEVKVSRLSIPFSSNH